MSQTEFWKQFMQNKRSWKIVTIGLRHIERKEAATAMATTGA